MEPRCTGHCCKGFALGHSYTEIQKDYQVWLNDSTRSQIPQVEIIAPMLIPLRSDPKYSEYLYTCKNLDSQGNCIIYESRPQMCRDFPDRSGCQFWKCTSSQSIYYQLSFVQKLITRWNWLRGLKKS